LRRRLSRDFRSSKLITFQSLVEFNRKSFINVDDNLDLNDDSFWNTPEIKTPEIKIKKIESVEDDTNKTVIPIDSSNNAINDVNNNSSNDNDMNSNSSLLISKFPTKGNIESIRSKERRRDRTPSRAIQTQGIY
jgi:hypothetical protein